MRSLPTALSFAVSEIVNISECWNRFPIGTMWQLAREAALRNQDQLSSLRIQAIHVLQRARKLPPGADRNDLRQLALGLRELERGQSFQSKPLSEAKCGSSDDFVDPRR